MVGQKEQIDLTLDELITLYSNKYGVSSYQIRRTIECESHFNNIQSNVVKNGVREESYGVAQIHLPSHPHITKEQALDISFAIEFMAQELKNGRDWKWYGYNKYTDECKSGY